MDLRYDVYPDASERISFGTAPSMKVCINKARKNKEVNAVIWGRFKECHGYKDVEVADLKDGQVGDLGWTLCPIERSADTKNSPVDIRRWYNYAVSNFMFLQRCENLCKNNWMNI